MSKFGIGQPIRRTEDQRLLTGTGIYTGDAVLPDAAYAHFVRSPHAHAAVTSIDVGDAPSMPGVLGVYTWADLKDDGVKEITCGYPMKQVDGSDPLYPTRPALAHGRVRHVGDPVVLIVAENRNAALDAAEAVMVDYDERPAVVQTDGAAAGGAPLVHDDIPHNTSFVWEMGNRNTVDSAFSEADRVVSLKLINNRVSANPLENRAVAADYDAQDGRFTVYVSSQGVHGMRRRFAATFGIEEKDIRVLTTDVGGGFGMKLFNYPEYVGVMFAARKLGRAVKWSADRSEAFISDDHGRDHVTDVDLAVKDDGTFLALRVNTTAALGAYLSDAAPFIPTAAGSTMLAGVYTFKGVHVTVRGVFTNTNPVDAYRGAGRPEAAYVVERITDEAARVLGMSPADIRLKNFIPPAAMPYKTVMDLEYDSGDFAQNLHDAIEMSDMGNVEARRADALKRGKLLGVGVASYIEVCAGGGPEQAQLQVDADGHIVLLIGTQTNGQGHETAYQQILSDRLGVPLEQITVIQGDSDMISFGGGTGGSRSVPVGGAATAQAAVSLINAGKAVASDLLEASAADIEFSDGQYRIVGTDRVVTFEEVAKAAPPVGDGLAFDVTEKWKPPAGTFPNGTHVCELEIDIETGVPEIVNYVVVDDFGVVINPLLVQGQIHGGVMQGVGQALYEECVYDPESGQLMSGSFMDYIMPRADHLPFLKIKLNCVPCTTNLLGIKGAGEAGAIGAPPAVINAVIDALKDYGVTHVDMPATPQKLWQLIQAGSLPQAAE